MNGAPDKCTIANNDINTTMEPITLIIGGIAIVLTVTLAYAVNKYREIQQKNIEIESLRRTLGQYEGTYFFEGVDKEMIDRCRVFLDKRFDGHLREEFAKYTTIEEKKEFAKGIVMELAQCIGVEVDQIQIEDIGLDTRGCANIEKGIVTVYLNEVLLVADPEQLVKTMCHELRHCVQFQSFTNNIWRYSPERVAQWLYSWDNYVQCESAESYEAYVKQIIETDANKFADAIFSA